MGVTWMSSSKSCSLAIVLFVLFCLIAFNINYLNQGDISTLVTTTTNKAKEEGYSNRYHVVIGSRVEFQSRRDLIRSSYFGIEDNLLPLKPLQLYVKYTFLIHGEQPNSNTVEKRTFETEKMEYNDILIMNKAIEYNQNNILDWVQKELKSDSVDYIIFQDIHSFIFIDNLIETIESKGDKSMMWGRTEKGFVIGSKALQDRKNTIISSIPLQIWENSIESVDLNNLVIGDVYQDQDFKQLVKSFGVQSLALEITDAKKVVVTSSYIYDRCMEPSGTRASLNKRDYANKHNYAFVGRSREFIQQSLRPDARRPVWGKIDIIQKVLPKYEWLFWLDMDAVILNDKISIEHLLQDVKTKYYKGDHFDEEIDFIIVKPGTDKMINAGVFLIKNTAWSMEFLRDVQKKQEWYRQGPSYEQGAMWDVMRQEKYLKKTLLLDRENHVFNTFPKFYEQDDFIVHFAPDKCPNDATVKGLNAADKIKQGKQVTVSDLL